MIEKVFMKTTEGTTINLLEMAKDSYGWLYGTLIQEGNECIAMVVFTQMKLAKKRWKDKV